MKSKTYVYTKDLKVIDYVKGHQEGNERMEITPRESIANYLANCPSYFVDGFWQYIIEAVRYSQSIGENDEQMLARIHANVMALTTESKRS